MQRSALVGIAWAVVGAVACAPALPRAASPGAPATGETADAAEPGARETAAGGEAAAPEIAPSPDDPFADIRAALERQKAGETRDPDPLAPLREGMQRSLEEEVRERQWGGTPKPAREDEGGSPKLDELAAEIAADARRREAMEQELEERFRRDMFAELEKAPLRNCVPSAESIVDMPGDFIFYREIERGDFRATEMPDGSPIVPARDFEPGAILSVSLMCVSGIRLVELGPDEFEARLKDTRFMAIVARAHSIWRHRGDPTAAAWILRHQQVHFDLAEVEARRLTATRDDVIESVYGHAATPMDAVRQLQERWDGHFRQVREGFLAVGRRYDEETRHGQDVEQQTRWYLRAKQGLADARRGREG